MRTAALLLAMLQIASPAPAPSRVTVAQLEQFLTSKRAADESDAEVADALMRVEPAEEVTRSDLARIGRESRLRPKTMEQIRLLAAESVFEAPPRAEWIDAAAPDAATQQRMLTAARAYAATALTHLPDFLAIRTTTGYDNAPQRPNTKKAKPVVRMHFVQQHRREVAYRNGAEVHQPAQAGARSGPNADQGFSTRGEFGPTLNMVLTDSMKGSVTWSRWQRGASGARLAVFRYSVPRAASQYEVHLCCFATDPDDPTGVSFHGKPAYHGELFVHPDSGIVERVTVEAELPAGTPLRTCSIEVEYGPVQIDGKPYICPVRGVAFLVFYSPSVEKIDGAGIERHINEVQFEHYHKFGSTSRMIVAN